MSQPIDPSDSSPEQDLAIRVPPGRVSGLKRKHIRLAAALLAAIIAAALIVGLGIDFHPRPAQERKIDLPLDNAQPSPIADLPSNYTEAARPKKTAFSNESGSGKSMDGMQAAQPSPQQQALEQELSRLSDSIQQVGQKNKELEQQVAAYQTIANQTQAKVWASELFFKIDDTAARNPQLSASHAQPMADQGQPAARAAHVTSGSTQTSEDQTSLLAMNRSPFSANNDLFPKPSAPQSPQSEQERKLAFLNDSSPPRGEAQQLVLQRPPDSRSGVYQLQAGTVIPAALLTGINTDLPGDVVAAVTSPVYDSATGNHLLIPQGARLYGSYDSQIAMSQDRALLVWQRLLFPDGNSVNLDHMRGVDGGGYAGVADHVDYHGDKLAEAALLSGVIAYAGNLARDPQENQNNSAGDVVGDAVAQQASAIGSKIVDRQLSVQPTITIRPGWPVRVLVNRDIVLPPYSN